ncbi:unnamed protein product [Lota lota]
MDPTSLFFSRLRRLAVTLETETECLQGAYQTRNDHGNDESVTERGMGAYHTLCNELAHLKGEIRVRLAQQLSREAEVNSYLAACGVMHRRLSEDIHTLKGHFEKYGYQAPPSTHTQSTDLGAEEGSASVEDKEEDGASERKDPLPPSTPQSAQLPIGDQLRTPKLADFGLSEVDLRHILIGAHRFPEAPPMPALSFTPSQSSLAPILSPDMLLTPRCVLHMEEEEQRTPQMNDFGISAHTLCLNNDFTMGLHQLATRSSNPHHQQPPPHSATQNPLPEMVNLQSEMENLTPEMPKMESMFSNTLLKRSARRACESGDPSVEPQVYSSLEMDGPTQEFNLRTPRVRLAYQDPPTPEMPDLSSITQDICKLVSRSELKKESNAVFMPIPRVLGKENRAVLLPLVVDSEFSSLPNYLRQMSLSSLNDSIHKINTAAAAKHRHGEVLQFQKEELKSITGVGTKAPIYFLCLEELHRLEHVQRVGKSSVYKLLPQH